LNSALRPRAVLPVARRCGGVISASACFICTRFPGTAARRRRLVPRNPAARHRELMADGQMGAPLSALMTAQSSSFSNTLRNSPGQPGPERRANRVPPVPTPQDGMATVNRSTASVTAAMSICRCRDSLVGVPSWRSQPCRQISEQWRVGLFDDFDDAWVPWIVTLHVTDAASDGGLRTLATGKLKVCSQRPLIETRRPRRRRSFS
jgi:hypothetical protein